MYKAIVVPLAAAAISLISSTVLAQSRVVWSCNAMAAVPAGAPIATGLHDALAGAVRFREGKAGNIPLICPVLDNLNGVSLRSLRLTYRDGDGREGPSEVTAVIRRVRLSDGHVATLQNGAVSSNDATAPNSGVKGFASHQSGSVGNVLSHVVDLDNFAYFIQINLKRTDAAVPLAVIGVHLIS